MSGRGSVADGAGSLGIDSEASKRREKEGVSDDESDDVTGVKGDGGVSGLRGVEWIKPLGKSGAVRSR